MANDNQFGEILEIVTYLKDNAMTRDEFNSRFDALDGKFDALDGKVEKLDGKVEKLECRVAAIEFDVADIKSGMSHMGDDIMEIKDITKNTVNILVEKNVFTPVDRQRVFQIRAIRNNKTV